MATAVTALSFGDDLRYEDEREYLVLADNLADTGSYTLDGSTPTAYRPPAYPFLLAGLRAANLEVVGLRMVNALLAGAIVALVFAIGQRIVSPATGAIGAVIAAIYPLLLYTNATLYPQAFATFLLLLATELALRVIEAEPNQRVLLAGGAGVTLGILFLTVPSFGTMLVIIPAWVAWRNRRAAVVPILVMTLVACLPIGLWTARNVAALGSFVPVATNGGFNLLLGNSPETTPTSGTQVDLTIYDEEARRLGLDEAETDRFFRSEAVEWIRTNPGDAAILYLGKLVNTFSVTNELATDEGSASTSEKLVLAASYLPLLILFALRILLAGRLPLHRGEGLLLSTFFINVFALAVFFTRVRFRVPLDAVMIMIVAILLSDLLRSAATKSRGASPGTPARSQP